MRNYLRHPSKILKIDDKIYIQNFLEANRMSFCHSIVLPIKTSSSFILNQAENLLKADMILSQQLIKKLIYLSCKIQLDIAFVVR